MPTNFVLKTDFGTFLVDTEGASYMRYIVRLPSSMAMETKEGAQSYFNPKMLKKKKKAKCEHVPGDVIMVQISENLKEGTIVDVHVYNKTLDVDVDGELLVCSFNSVTKSDVAEDIVQSALEGKDIGELLDKIVENDILNV